MAKTQAQIEARLKAYAKGNVDSPYRIKKPTSYDARFGKMEVGVIDADAHFHGQCILKQVYYKLIELLGHPNVKSRAISSEAYMVKVQERSTTKYRQLTDSGEYCIKSFVHV